MITQNYISERQLRVEQLLNQFLPDVTTQPQILHEAMRYAVLNGGKRLRPLLVYASGETCSAPLESLDHAACAIELIHAYSLVHDDLPIMDNDDFRRGQPTCHKIYGDAIALLVGDALQTLAFEVLAQAKLSPTQILAMFTVLTKAIGSLGMAGGQAMEFIKLEKTLEVSTLETIHQLKTGALISAAIQLGAIAAKTNAEQYKQLENFANYFGLAYQVQDDIDDNDSTAFSYTNLAGLSAAKNRLQNLHNQASTILNNLDQNTAPLNQVLNHMIPIQ